jgi:O-antigen ligase
MGQHSTRSFEMNITPTEKLHKEDRFRARPAMRAKLETLLEYILVVALCFIPYMLFFSIRLKSVFDYLSIALLLIWRFLLRNEQARPIPRHFLVIAGLYATSFLVSAAISDNGQRYPPELNSLRIILLAGLLYTAPISAKGRKLIITVFFIVAAASGIVGTFQYFFDLPASGVPSGYVLHHIAYAGMLAFACGSATIMLFVRGNRLYQSTHARVFLVIAILCMTSGILLSQARGVWLAFFIAIVVTAVLYDPRKGIVFFIALLLVLTMIFSFSDSLRQRAVSIVTSFSTEDETGSTGNRLELWKGSLMIFLESPIFGTGLWDFDTDIEKLIKDAKIKDVPVKCHAHNIYLHLLATRGAVGLTAAVALLVALLWRGLLLSREQRGIGGFFIIYCTLVIMLGGLTEASLLDGGPYAFTFWYSIGLLGPVRPVRTDP